MLEQYLIPTEEIIIDEEIKHSRFISIIFPCSCETQLKQKMLKVKSEYPAARHYCYAFVAGAPDNSVLIGSSDDGEPAGSAGRPMLAALQGSNLGEIAVIVVRYFGGIKLGVGGLVRAYSAGIKAALPKLTTELKRIRYPTQLVCRYDQLQDIEHLVLQSAGLIVEKTFTDTVQLTIELPKSSFTSFNQDLAMMSQGMIQVSITQ